MLLRRGDAWEVAAQSGSGPEKGQPFSRSVLQFVLAERRTFYQSEVAEGMACLSKPGPEEKHLKGNFRLSCCARIAAEQGTVRCHTMRRGTIR